MKRANYLGPICKRGHDDGGGSLRYSSRWCVQCAKESSVKKSNQNKIRCMKSYWADPEKARELARDYRARTNYEAKRWSSNKADERQRYKAWCQRNPAKVRARNAGRRASRLMATPSWADRKYIGYFYEGAAAISAKTGVTHHVDHIVPLRGRGVCGLHVPWNLQILSVQENTKKSNSFVEAEGRYEVD